LHTGIELRANLNFLKKRPKFRNQRCWMSTILTIKNMQNLGRGSTDLQKILHVLLKCKGITFTVQHSRKLVIKQQQLV